MLEKDEDHGRKQLALEEKHSRELAKKSQDSAEEMSRQPCEEDLGPDGAADGQQEAEGARSVQNRDAPHATERTANKASS